MDADASIGRGNAVADHYDALDPIYRKIWGADLHHGLWDDGVRGIGEAGRRMTARIGERLGLRPGERIWDVGCGCGAMAAELSRRFGVEAGGTTNSRRQRERAAEGVDLRLGDWLENGLATGSFDAVLAVESIEHMEDPAAALAEMARVLRPGGRLVVASWMFCDDPGPVERRLLMPAIRRGGFLPGMADGVSLRRWIAGAGLELVDAEDLGERVAPTWSAATRKALRLLSSDREMVDLVRSAPVSCSRLALALALVRFGYATGLLRYELLTALKPA